MALITCPECGKNISDMAQSCPNCGRPLEKTMNVQKRSDVIAAANSKKKGHGCLIIVLVMLFFCVMAVHVATSVPGASSGRIISRYLDVTNEQAVALDGIVKECGIEKLISFEHDESLDNAHGIEGEKGYRAAISENLQNLTIYLTEDLDIYNINFKGYDLYLDGEVLATVQDYTMTSRECSNLKIKCEEKIKEILKSPSTAEFPNILEWKFAKEKNIVYVQGYVDAQNGFGAEIRSTFQFTIDTDTDTIQSLIFDGEELIGQ